LHFGFELFARFIIDLIFVLALLFAIYYPRYKRKETVISASLFNIFTFAVLSILSSVDFGITTGFGLFAILALFTLRSEQINKSDIAYFFGSISIAVITSVDGTSLLMVLLILSIVLVASYAIDHPKVLKTVSQMRVELDHIPDDVVSNPDALLREFSNRLGVKVIAVRILNINYITEVVSAEVNYRVEA
jgi:hypothetical protein